MLTTQFFNCSTTRVCVLRMLQLLMLLNIAIIMEYGSTPYVGMARKKMAAPLDAYKITYVGMTREKQNHMFRTLL